MRGVTRSGIVAGLAGARLRGPRHPASRARLPAPHVLAHPDENQLLVVEAQPAVEVVRIDLAQAVILDARDEPGGRVQRTQAALGGAKVVVAQGIADRELIERHPAGDQVAHGRVAMLEPEIAGVETIPLHRHEGLGDEPLIHVERTQGRTPHLRPLRDGWRHLRFLLVYSPRWLFLYPGILLMALGAAGMLWLLPGPRTVGDVTFDVQTLLFTAMTIVIEVNRIVGTIVHTTSSVVWPWIGGPSDQSFGSLTRKLISE